ncbi:hypothetical protein LEP1GSC185_3953 [Leptospira licerasiae serovar Varillal str. VAR 010]|nr:hypothetical protein LEP1GSC185_3953 [Leptospira licerasiae serovar Varillal str. VAR 010]
MPYEPSKHCKGPLYLPKDIPNAKAVSVKGVRIIESNNRDCLDYIQRVAINNTEYAIKNKPNSFMEDFTIFSYGILFSLCLAIFLFV